MLNEMKDKAPPTLPQNFSPEFRDFIALCLTKDPTKVRNHPCSDTCHSRSVLAADLCPSNHQRPSARVLLDHPFVSGCCVEEPEPELEDGDGSETARMELDEIVRVVRDYYRSLWRDQARQSVSPTVPNFHRVKIRNLASELGIAEETVRLRFAYLSRVLRDDAKEFWSSSEHER